MNIIQKEDHRFYRLITLAYKYAPLVVVGIIDNYLNSHNLSFEQFLNNIKHEMYHKRHNTSACCSCDQLTSKKVFLEVQWTSLFQSKPNSQHVGHDLSICHGVFSARTGIDLGVCDVSLASALINNVSDLLQHYLNGLGRTLHHSKGFETFLEQNKHILFHSLDKRRCCQCTSDPDKKEIFRRKEWSKLYRVQTTTTCQHSICSCKFNPIPGLTLPSVDPKIVSKIGQAVGPVILVRSIRNKLAHSKTSALSDQDFESIWAQLTSALNEILSIFGIPSSIDLQQRIVELKNCPIDGSMLEELRQLIERDADLKKLWMLLEGIQIEQAVQGQTIGEVQLEQTVQRQNIAVQGQNITQLQQEQTAQSQVTTEILKEQTGHKNDISEVKTEQGQIREGQKHIIEKQKEHTEALKQMGAERYTLEKYMKGLAVPSTKDPQEIIPEHIINQHKDVIHDWESDDDKFTDTRASTKVRELLQNFSHVVVTGISGNGKSTILHHIALELQREEGYQIIPFLTHGPSDVIQYRDPSKKQVFVIDDPCGKHSLNSHSIDEWSSHIDTIEKILGANKELEYQEIKQKIADSRPFRTTILLISCRLHIFKVQRFQNMKYITHPLCDLTSDDFRLTADERMSMLKNYVSEDIANAVQDLVEMYEFFPLLCKLSENKNLQEVKALLKEPIKDIEDHLKRLLNEEYDRTLKIQKCIILMCLLFDNTIEENWLASPPEDKKEKMSMICEECDVKFNTESSKVQLAEQFQILEKTLIKKIGNVYSMIHDKIYDIAAVLYAKYFFNLFLNHASSIFISEKFRFSSIEIKESDEKLFVGIPIKKESAFFDRLRRDLQKGDTYILLHSTQLQYEPYRKKLIEFCRSVWPLVCDKLKEAPKLNRGSREDEIEFLSTDDDVTYQAKCRNILLQTKIPLMEATFEGNTDIVTLLLEAGCNVNQSDKNGRTALHVGALLGNKTVVEILLKQKGVDMHQRWVFSFICSLYLWPPGYC